MADSHTPTTRRERAERDVAALGRCREEHLLLRVRCQAGHDVAAVYGTVHGPVFVSRAAHRGAEHVDALDGNGEDLIPAWCACGTRRISRSALLRRFAYHERTLVLI
ncbi:hypothetical protein QRX60_40955 [Amycolatopsis mongoliensis]|uniref:Uncharacterized protein n=1 Tax=Amycolatopsis mongoliensis TaxID=715475 RepID=A0A9Y2JMV0_9PSEU|nr:hypothetical protein [Amycolatopsis sp. 4-36]WIY00366.1 hypothetical protein QRX60_40955 [Amycolatopsis sp. 4-36]